MKNILIYTVTAGNGHNTIANTIKNSLKKEYGEEVNILVIDFLKDYKTPVRAFIYDKAYRFVVKHCCMLYNFCFKMKLKSNPVSKNSLDIKISLIGKYKKIMQTIKNFNPNYIFCSHFLPAIALSNLKKIKKIDIPFGSIVSDFVVCPFTKQAIYVDDIFLASNNLVKNALAVGFSNKQIKVLGFPSKLPKNEYVKNYFYSDKKLNIVIMSGSGNFKYLSKNIKNLFKEDMNIELTLISGNNKKDYLKNNKMMRNNKTNNMSVKCFGEVDFVNNYEHYKVFKNCDIIVTKCGANSLVEALNNSKIVISTNNLAQQEKENIKFFSNKIPLFLIDKNTTLVDIIKSNNFDKNFFEEYKKKINNLMQDGVDKKYAEYIYRSCK